MDGRSITVMGDIKHSFDEESKELRKGVDGHVNIKVIPEVPFIELKASDVDDVDVQDFSTAEDVTITIEKRNQKIGTLVNAHQVNQVEVDDIESTMVFRFEGTEKAHETLAP